MLFYPHSRELIHPPAKTPIAYEVGLRQGFESAHGLYRSKRLSDVLRSCPLLSAYEVVPVRGGGGGIKTVVDRAFEFSRGKYCGGGGREACIAAISGVGLSLTYSGVP